MLEDAGLLDALVVLPPHVDAADALLTTEGLSDCRLDLTHLAQFQADAESSAWNACLLRSDPALRDTLGAQATSWEEVTQAILQQMERTVHPAVLQQDAQYQRITWTHGLLTGMAGEGTARCIGRATRIREQHRALEQLHQQWELLENELKALDSQIEHLEQQRQYLENMQNRLGEIWKVSEVEGRYTQFKTTFGILRQADERYQERRNESQALRLHITTLRIELQKATADVPIFASSSEMVDQAHDATSRLASEQRTLLSYLERLRAAWQEHNRAQEQLTQDKAAEWRAAQAQQKSKLEAQRAKAQLETLMQLVQQTDKASIDNLLGQLQAWQAQQENEGNAQAILEATQRRCHETYQRFLTRLDTYPVELLVTLKQRIERQAPLEIAQSMLDIPLEAQEEIYHQRKTELEGHREREQNALIKIVYEVNNLLHENGPQYDEQGIVRFQNADRSNAAELLNRLGEEISHQKQLLGARERELFQNFLLEEMADSIGKHITDAEDWVRRMNKVLSQTAFVGTYYHLRWTPRKEEQTQARPGNRLAQYHDLLRRQAQTFKQEEIDQLVHAFRQEISTLRTQPQTTNAANFSEALAHIFDYRNWFQFEIYILRADGSSLHLTNRFFKKRTCPDQYVTLYIPFFAALSALYERAGQGAPRMIALDEAFDKVSIENTHQLLKFLAQQQFQCIITGPRVTGEVAKIPACVKYTMFCDKDRELAAGFPSFWSSDHSLAERIEV